MRPRFALSLIFLFGPALCGFAGRWGASECFTFWVRPINVRLTYGAQDSGRTAYSAVDVLYYLTSIPCGPAGDSLTFSISAGEVRGGLRYRRWTISESQPIPRGYVCPVPLQLNDQSGKFLEVIKIFVRTQ